jgi:C-terminal processing protease CtpA/Prc
MRHPINRADNFRRASRAYRLHNMPPPNSRRTVLALLFLTYVGAATPQEPKGTFGFAAKVDAEGVFSPVLKAVLIQSVEPGMPAALAGMVRGDSIVEVEGVKVAGAKASAMADRMRKKPGEAVVLRLLRTTGESYVVTLIAAAAKSQD